ncbi:MAG: hypothetical protein AB7K09_01805 [Planctomycetota bacterium]
MPGWHNATLDLQKSGKFVMLGITEEQHGDRCALFMQWQKMGWPILVDSLNLLDFDRVPFTLAIDKRGIIRDLKLKPEDLEAEFLDKDWPVAPDDTWEPETTIPMPDFQAMDERVEGDGANDAVAWRNMGDAYYLWGDGNVRFTQAIDAYSHAIPLKPLDGRAAFRRGVAHRSRYDSDARHEGDFAAAVADWTAALETNRSQYIWRRRIQQYGPRLDKPYSFYDWVNQARSEIKSRNEVPTPLRVEPGGAEFAYPQKDFSTTADQTHPDPDGELPLDDRSLVQIDTAVAPAHIVAGASARVHVVVKPDTAKQAHWDNEAGPITLWADAPAGWEISSHLQQAPGPDGKPQSTDERHLEFEVRSPAGTAAGEYTVSGFVLCFVCEDVDGVCHYLRHNFSIHVVVRDE